MHLKLHQFDSFNEGNKPVYVCANDIQVIEHNGTGSRVTLFGKSVLPSVIESPSEILEFLMEHLPERWM